jgi:hypothetical protein
MKRQKGLYLGFIALLIASSISCSKDSVDAVAPAEESRSAVFSESRLSFASVEEAEAAIGRLLAMTAPEQAAWYASKKADFISQESVFQSAVAEVETLTDLAEADLFKEKYKPYLLFNDDPADEELYNPYLPSDQFGYSLICNKNGDVEIGGEIKNFNNLSSVKETFYYKTSHEVNTRAVVERPNYLFGQTSDRKFWAEAKRFSNDVVIEFNAHKKNLFGWNIYRTSL